MLYHYTTTPPPSLVRLIIIIRSFQQASLLQANVFVNRITKDIGEHDAGFNVSAAGAGGGSDHSCDCDRTFELGSSDIIPSVEEDQER